MSARRTSTVDKDDVKRMSSRMEKIMRDTTLGNEVRTFKIEVTG